MNRKFHFFGAITLVFCFSSGAVAHAGDPSPTVRISIDPMVQFESNSARIDKKVAKKLNELLQRIQSFPDRGKISLDGNADASEKNPQPLSLMRAQAVRNYFVKNGFPASDLEVKGWGNVRPIADNATAKGRALNRRVDFRQVNEPPQKPGEPRL